MEEKALPASRQMDTVNAVAPAVGQTDPPHPVNIDRVGQLDFGQTMAVRGFLARLVAPWANGSAHIAGVDEIDEWFVAGGAVLWFSLREDVQRRFSAPTADQDRVEVHDEPSWRPLRQRPRSPLGAATSGARSPSQRAQ